MSVPEQKPVEKSLADQRVDKILAEIKVLQEEMKKYEPPSKKEIHSHDESRHFQKADLENVSCPNCKKNVDELKQEWGKEYADAHGLEIAQKVYKERETLPKQCVECGIGVTEKEADDPTVPCPFCGKNARTHSR